MRRLVLALAVLSIPLAAQAANWEIPVVKNDRQYQLCRLTEEYHLLCGVRWADSDDKAMEVALTFLTICNESENRDDAQCRELRLYVKERFLK